MPTSPRHGSLRRDERGDIVLGWLTRLALSLTVLGVVGFDALSISSTRFSLDEHGASAAREAASTWGQTNDVQRAYDAAVATASDQNPDNRLDPKKFRIDPDGTVHLNIERVAKTVAAHRLDATADWAEIDRDASGRTARY